MTRSQVADPPAVAPRTTDNTAKSTPDAGDRQHLGAADKEIHLARLEVGNGNGNRGSGTEGQTPVTDQNGKVVFNKTENPTVQQYLTACTAWLKEHLRNGQDGVPGAIDRTRPPQVAVNDRQLPVPANGVGESHAMHAAMAALARPEARQRSEGRIDATAYAGDRALLEKGPPEGADKIHQRENGRTKAHDTPDYAKQRQELLQHYGILDKEGKAVPESQLTAQQLQARHEIVGIEQRMQKGGHPPLAQGEAARMFSDLNKLLSTPGEQLSGAMGGDAKSREADARQHSIEFMHNVGHCEGTDSSIRQYIGSCGIMGTYGDLCRAAPSKASELLVAGMTAQKDSTTGMYTASMRDRNGNDIPFSVHSSFMQNSQGRVPPVDAAEMFHGMSTNLMWNKEGRYYTIDAATGQGATGARFHQGSFDGPKMLDPSTATKQHPEGTKYYDSPNTTWASTSRLDDRLNAGTIRVFDSTGAAPGEIPPGGLGPSMVDVRGATTFAQREQIYIDALRRGGGTIQMLGDGGAFLGLRNAGRDAYHNTSLSCEIDGNTGEPKVDAKGHLTKVILTDTNKGLSNDNYDLKIADAGIKMHENAESIAYKRTHPGGRSAEDDAQFGMKKKDDSDVPKKPEDEDKKAELKRRQAEERDALARARVDQARAKIAQISAAQEAWRSAHPGEALPESIGTVGADLLAQLGTTADQFT